MSSVSTHVRMPPQHLGTMAQVAPDLHGRTLTMNGLSKAYCMTGWRLGYGAGPTALVSAIAKIQSQTTSGRLASASGRGALEGDQTFIQRKRGGVRGAARPRPLDAESGGRVELQAVGPCFYLYVDCRGAIGKRTPDGGIVGKDGDFAKYLLDNQEVAVVHGEAFGLSPYFRVSFALATDRLAEACTRIQRACALLSG